MTRPASPANGFFAGYAQRLQSVLASSDWSGVERLAAELGDCWRSGRQVFLCGNGGSAGNAIHLANDFLYGISKTFGSGLRVSALPANSSVLTYMQISEDLQLVVGHMVMQWLYEQRPGKGA